MNRATADEAQARKNVTVLIYSIDNAAVCIFSKKWGAVKAFQSRNVNSTALSDLETTFVLRVNLAK
jgi:hypothetical protein